MRIFSFVLVFACAVLGFSDLSMARKTTQWGFVHHDGSKLDFQPYVGHELLSQRSTKDMDSWIPSDWIKVSGDEKAILRDFYGMGILKKQYIGKNNIPALLVGEAFIKLSSFDQKRVLEFVDYVFKIVESEENGMFFVYYDQDKKEPLGVFNNFGYLRY